jgi:hypothetical protein
MSKSLVLMRDVICVYHPEFINSEDLRKFGVKNPDIFNVERLVEESLAAVGHYNFVNATGYDFLPDFSDSKTATVATYDNVMAIGSIESKIGALRVTIYNPHKQSLDYMFMPFKDWKKYKECSYGKNEHKERLRTRWNQKNDHYNSFEQFRVKTFEELALAQ